MKNIFLMSLLCFCCGAANAQFNYLPAGAQSFGGVYTDLGSNGSAITVNYENNAMTFDDDNSSVQSIGFNFTYDGRSFNQFVLNTNGFIKLGNTAAAKNNYNVRDADDTDIIAAFNADLIGAFSPEYRVLTSGAAGSRVCVIQFKNLQEKYVSRQYNNVNFQIKLYETSNTIEFVYGSFTPSANAPSSAYMFIGLINKSQQRTLSTYSSYPPSWINNVQFSQTGIFFSNQNDSLPDVGRTFRFTASPITDAAVKAVFTMGELAVPSSYPHTIMAKIANEGATTVTNLPVTLHVNSNNGIAEVFSNTQPVTLLPQTDTVISFDAYQQTVTGEFEVNVSIPEDDWNDNSTLTRSQTVNTNLLSYADGGPVNMVWGWGTNPGMMLSKYEIHGTSRITKAHINIAAAAGDTVFAVILDASGNIIGKSEKYITTDEGQYQYKTFDIIERPLVTNSPFYIGLAQTANVNGYLFISLQTEKTPHPGAHYYLGGTEGGTVPVDIGIALRFMIKAEIENISPLLPLNSFDNTYWTWVGGDSLAERNGVYGTMGISSAANKPGARKLSSTWTDSLGNFYLFGGYGFGKSGPYPGALNDLWKYNIDSALWTWIGGDSTVDVLENAGHPAGRHSASAWKDKQGNFWLYGGMDIEDPNTFSAIGFSDLWKYNPAANTWTRIKDNGFNFYPNYGNIGVGGITNSPGSRCGAAAWTDTLGVLWLFGGMRYSGEYTPAGRHNNQPTNIQDALFLNCGDLWKYDTGTSLWTWVKGDSIAEQLGNAVGEMGTESVFNRPGARKGSATWLDKTSNQLWLFGGAGFDDLWRYNIATGNWSWMKGNSTIWHPASYGTAGEASPENNPGGRNEPVAWTDNIGNFWLFGGETQNDILNDLWKYNLQSNEWTWLKGSFQNQEGHYGELGNEAPENIPPARSLGASWTDSLGNLWMFGGNGNPSWYNTKCLGDLWKIYAGTTYIFNGSGSWDTASNWISSLVAPKNIPSNTRVLIDHTLPGTCVVDSSIEIQPLGNLTVRLSKRLNIVNGNLSNRGRLFGPGEIIFTGTLTSLESSGTITAPLILDNKRMFLTGNTNTAAVSLLNNSYLYLRQYNLNMGTNPLIADSVNFIVTNDTGSLNRIVSGTPIVFPVGTDTLVTKYFPATITNTGVTDSFYVRVEPNVLMHRPAANDDTLQGNVNLTWHVSEALRGGSIVNLRLQWDSTNEQVNFRRILCYVSQVKDCEPPPNCRDVYYDRTIPAAASGNNPFSIDRDNITGFSRPLFTVSSQLDVRTFTGNVDSAWNNPHNWTIGIVPESSVNEDGIPVTVIHKGMELIIDPNDTVYPANRGVCEYTGKIIVEPGGILTVMPGKTLRIKEP